MLRKIKDLYKYTLFPKIRHFLLGYILSSFLIGSYFLYIDYINKGNFNPVGEWFAASFLPLILSFYLFLYGTAVSTYFFYLVAYYLIYYLAFKASLKIPHFKTIAFALLQSGISILLFNWLEKNYPVI